MFVRSFEGPAARVSPADIAGLPFALEYGSVPAGTSQPRNLDGGEELVLVLAGSGFLDIAPGGPRRVIPGHAAYVARCGTYTLGALPDASLDFVSITWGDDRRPRSGEPVAVVRSFDRGAMQWSYEMHLDGLFDHRDIPGLGFGMVYGSVPPRSESKYHCHQDGELFLILGGRAHVDLDEESHEVGRGDLMFLTPFGVHGIRNTSDEPFDLVSTYWDDNERAGAALAAHPARDDISARSIVFCPPPTPNGGLHLGHMSGPYLRADMYARSLRTLGAHCDLVTGTDDHQSYVAATAHRMGIAPASVARMFGDGIVDTLRGAGVDTARVYRPVDDQDLETGVRNLFAAIEMSAAFRRAAVPTPWCPICQLSLYQAFAGGSCPNCSRDCDGEICEACGLPNEARALSGLACRRCGATPEVREEPALLLDLDAFAAPLRKYVSRVEGSGPLRLLVHQLLDSGLGLYRLTRASEWGMPIDGSSLAAQVLDPWVELALTQLEEHRRLAGGSDCSCVTFLGYDNSYYYGVLLPVLAFATGLESALPSGYVTNQFLHLDGAKFSTSRGHAVWTDDVLVKFPPDVMRFVLLRRAPEDGVGDISSDEIAILHQDRALESLREWLTGFQELPGDGIVPGTGAWTPTHREVYRFLSLVTEQLDGLLLVDAFSSVAYVEALEGLVRQALQFRRAERSRRLLGSRQEEARTSLALEYLLLKAYAGLVAPVMPSVGAELWAGLAQSEPMRRERHWQFIPAGTQTNIRVPAALARADRDGSIRC